MLKTLKSASKGGACDLAGWHYEHLQLTLGKVSAFDALLAIVELVATGKLSEEFYALASLGRVTPLKKGLKNKLRPLVCGCTWRRIAMSALCGQHKAVFRQALGQEQYAVGVKSALEKLAATLGTMLKLHPDSAVLQIDAVSAFNNTCREVML